ncbi:hypothetical protein Tco_0638499 [Tanacetum coccineum]
MQYSVVHQPPQEETSLEFLHDKRNLINYVQTFLGKFKRFSFYETPKVVSLAWETISEIEHAFEDKQYQPEGILELFRKLHDDVQNIHEELAEYITTPNWNRPIVYYDDDDDDEDYTIANIPDLSTKISRLRSIFCDSEPDSGNFTMDVVEDIFDNPTREPRVHVPNVLPTHLTLHLDLDFTIFSDSPRSGLVVSFLSGTRNKIFDPGIFIEVQSKRFLSTNEFSISFIRDPLSPVFDTLLPFSSEYEDNVFNPGILASNEEKSPHLLSHRGFKAFHLISKSPMMISGGNIPILDVPFLHFYPP